jgi:hypothetical protein
MTYRIRSFRNTRKQSKYKNSFADYGGAKYHSMFEAKVARDLDIRKRAKDIKSWERQVRVSLDVNGQHICNYFVDFLVTHNDDSLEYIEAKGFATEVWRLKWKLFEALLDTISPGARITILKP